MDIRKVMYNYCTAQIHVKANKTEHRRTYFTIAEDKALQRQHYIVQLKDTIMYNYNIHNG